MGSVTPYIAEAEMSKDGKVKPFRAIVMAPSIMVHKWKREIEERVPQAHVQIIRNFKDVKKLENQPYEPTRIEFYIMSFDIAKETYPRQYIMDWREKHDVAKLKRDNGEKPRIRFKYTHRAIVNKRLPDGTPVPEDVFDSRAITRTETVLKAVSVGSESSFHCPSCGGMHMIDSKKHAHANYFNRSSVTPICKSKVKTHFLPKERVLKKEHRVVYRKPSSVIDLPLDYTWNQVPMGAKVYSYYLPVTSREMIDGEEVEVVIGKELVKREARLFQTEELQNCGYLMEQSQKLDSTTFREASKRWSERGGMTNRVPKKSGYRKTSPAWYLNKYFKRGFFKYLICDEVHKAKSGDSLIGQAFGQLINHTKKQILLTGTLLGGMAEDIFYLLAKLDPKRLQKESIGYKDLSLFIERYGIVEHKFQVTSNNGGRESTRKKKGSANKPGVSPHAFGRYLINNCCFLELADMGYALPPYREDVIYVDMDEEHMAAYQELERRVGGAMRQNAHVGGSRYVAQYLNRMYQYADMPFNQGPLIAKDEHGNQRILAEPMNFDIDTFTPPKYRALESKIHDEVHNRGRKVLVYARFVGKDSSVPVDTYLYDRLKAQGYNVGILRNGGKYDGIKMPEHSEEREAWLEKMMEANDWDVLVTNPDLVQVGLDLLQFPTIIYYQMDYSTYNFMQSSRRSWRIRQQQPVEVYTMVYRNTIQFKVLDHMSRKIDASLALQGKFSEEGLRALAESGNDMNALAKRMFNDGSLDDIESFEARARNRNQSFEEMQNSTYEDFVGYDQSVMNPLGIERVREIAQGLANKITDDIKAGRKVSKADLEFLKHLTDILTVADSSSYNKGLKKKDRIVEDQLELSLF